jgi:hypothetical protein
MPAFHRATGLRTPEDSAVEQVCPGQCISSRIWRDMAAPYLVSKAVTISEGIDSKECRRKTNENR